MTPRVDISPAEQSDLDYIAATIAVADTYAAR